MSPTDNYLSFFSSLTNYAPISALSLFVLGLFRIAPTVISAPFFGAKTPPAIKMGLLVSFSIIMLPHMTMTSHTMIGFNANLIFLCLKELFIGFILSFFICVPFYMAETSGVIIDFLRGSSALQVGNPLTQTQSSDLGILYNYMLIVIFFQIDGPFYFFNALFETYTLVPADGWIPETFFRFDHTFWNTIWGSVNKIISVGIQLAAPSLLAILMTEMFLGIANRLAPQVQIAFLGMSLKSLVGLAILCAAWFFILRQMNTQTLDWLKDMDKVIKTLGS